MLSPSESDAERLFTELAEGGTVRMPLQKTFWAVSFGMLTDCIGIPWVINCEKSEISHGSPRDRSGLHR